MKPNKAARYWSRHNPKTGTPTLSPRRARIVRASVGGKIDRGVIIARDNSTCYLCGKQVAKKQLQIDHVFPLVKGGAHTYENLRVACAVCNGRKGDLTLDEFRVRYGLPLTETLMPTA